MDLSIVITTRNRKEYLLDCIKSVKDSDVRNLELEIIVIDDNSSDGTEKINSADFKYEGIRIIHNVRQQMLVRSRNLGAKSSTGRNILFIDDDNVIDPSMIKILVDFSDKNSNFGIVGPSMYFFDSKEKYLDFQKINLFTGHTKGIIGDGDSTFYESDGIPNVFMIKKEVFDACGYFDESIIQTFTEPDFAKRATRFNYLCCIVPSAKTYHKVKKEKEFKLINTNEQFNQKAYCSIRNRTVYIARYGNFLNKVIYFTFFSWLWPFLYSYFAIKGNRIDMVNLYWRGFLDGVVFLFTGRLNNSVEIK